MLQAGAQTAVSGVVAAPEYYYPQVSCTAPGFQPSMSSLFILACLISSPVGLLIMLTSLNGAGALSVRPVLW